MKPVVILYGRVSGAGREDEQDTMVQVSEVAQALSRLGCDPLSLPMTLDLDAARRSLETIRPAAVFNLVESVQGQDRLLHLGPALLDTLGIPYTGASTEAIFLTSNKLLAKRILSGAGLSTPPAHMQGQAAGDGVVPGEYMIKSVWEHASVGMGPDSVVSAADGAVLEQEMERRKDRFRGPCFAEKYIDGREFNLSLLAGPMGAEVLPPAEIRFEGFPPDRRRIVDYRAKWDPASFASRHTCRTFAFPAADGPLLDRLTDTARACWDLFSLRGYARVDFRVDEAGMPWILEVNANPCLSPDGGFAAAAAQAGISFDSVISRILRDL